MGALLNSKYDMNVNLTLPTIAVFLLLAPLQADAAVKFRSPLSDFRSPAFSAYMDNDRTTGRIKDYKCSTNTYDAHPGTDFRASIGTQIYGSAAGGAYQTYNGCPDTGTLESTCGTGKYGNQVRIDHGGTSYYDGRGLVTIYAHMQLGTPIGQSSLLCGAKIGKTGKSGKLTGPHLHFEVRTDGLYPSTIIDPFAGSCSQTTSYWVGLDSTGQPKTTCQ